jgi:hypothetical protein
MFGDDNVPLLARALRIAYEGMPVRILGRVFLNAQFALGLQYFKQLSDLLIYPKFDRIIEGYD